MKGKDCSSRHSGLSCVADINILYLQTINQRVVEKLHKFSAKAFQIALKDGRDHEAQLPLPDGVQEGHQCLVASRSRMAGMASKWSARWTPNCQSSSLARELMNRSILLMVGMSLMGLTWSNRVSSHRLSFPKATSL